MAGGQWNILDYPAATVAATASQAAAAITGGVSYVNRLKTLTVSVSGDAAASSIVRFVVRDGATGAGTIIWSATLRGPIGGSASIFLSDLDLRSSAGNALTIESVAGGGAGSQISVAASGDIVPVGFGGYQI